MNRKALVAVAGLCLSIVSTSVFAHHSFSAQFDSEQPITLVGTVTKVVWRNPHAWFYFDVVDENDQVTNWGLELASPNLLMRSGWTRSAMKIGDEVTVEGFLARDGSHTGNARAITINATGKKLETRSSYKEDEE